MLPGRLLWIFLLAVDSHKYGVSSWCLPRITSGPRVQNIIQPYGASLLSARRSPEYDYYDTYYDEDKEEEEEEENDVDPYWEQQEQQEQQQQQQRGGMYKVYFDGDVDPQETQLDWEVCNDGNSEALVLLPPAAVKRPTAILHFVGGTFFGSAPKLWYRSLLEGLVRNTNCAIVVTPIPVTLFKSPLQHIELCQKLQRSFSNAWNTVLEDEYGNLDGIPLCGIGHSLGARLLVVLSTLQKNKPRGRIPSYKSMVLVSFTNYGASAGIPGVSALLKQSRRNDQTNQVSDKRRKRRRAAQRVRQDSWADDDYDDDDEDDEEWEEILDDLQGIFQEQAARVKTVLTPKSKDLEFSPSPDMLWKALKEDQRYSIPETLIVQFDNDQVDQSSKLAQILLDTNSTDVKFARLRGTHLSPLSVNDGESRGWLELTSRASKTIWKVIRGRGKSEAQEASMRDVRQSIARYITDVVTK
jgi:hypothetical protein